MMENETRLIVGEKDRPLAFLDLDDATLGKFARQQIIGCENALQKLAGNREMPLTLARTIHAALSFYRLCVEANAAEYELIHEDVNWGGQHFGDWSITIRRLRGGEGPARG